MAAQDRSVSEGRTKLLQGVDGILHVDPEPESPQGDGVIGDGERKLQGGTVYFLSTPT